MAAISTETIGEQNGLQFQTQQFPIIEDFLRNKFIFLFPKKTVENWFYEYVKYKT